MNSNFLKNRPKTSAAYQCVRDEKPIEKVETVFQEKEEDPMFAYGVAFACHIDLYKSAVMTQIEKVIGKSKQEDRITQWKVSAAGQYTQCVAQIKKEDLKKLYIGWRNQSATFFGMEEILPQEKDKLTITETFMPIRPAIQTGKVLGLPTEGYIYHFLEGKLVHEYRFNDKANNRFFITRSVDGAMNTELLSESSFDFILAISEKGGQTVTDQYLLYSREPLDDDAMQSVDKAFLDENGIQLDMCKLTQLVGGPGFRKHHLIEKGDTLIKIAKKFGLSLEEIYELNPYWKGKERKLEIGQKVYLEELAEDFNHALDVFYPTSGDFVAPWLFVIRKVVSAMAFPVVTIARSLDSGFAALAPVRYAIDVYNPETLKNDVIEGLNTIEDKTVFTGGIFRSDRVPYTLRQLRDGWLYMLSQDPETEEWSVSEYQVTKSELYRYVGNTVEERANAEAEKPKSYLLYPTDRPCYIGFSIQRWTQRIQDIYVNDEEVRKGILRDAKAEEHRAYLNDIEAYVADVGDEKDLSIFDWTSASAVADEKDKDELGLISYLMKKTHHDYQYLVPIDCDHHFIALDDPIADITDLHLRLSQSILPTLQDDETHRKTVIAETIRSMVRISIPQNILKGIHPSKWISVEQDIDICLEHHYSQYVLNKYSRTAQNYYAAKAIEVEGLRKAYLAALSRLKEIGIDEALLKARFPEYIERRKAHSQVNWKDLDIFYKDFLETRAKCIEGASRDLPNLLDALEILAPQPTHFGLDEHTSDTQLTLCELMDKILQQMSMGAHYLDTVDNFTEDDFKENNKRINGLINDPNTLIGLTNYFFSKEFYLEQQKLVEPLSIPEMINSNRVPIAGFLAAFNDVIGFNGEQSRVFEAARKTAMPLQKLIQSLKNISDRSVEQIHAVRFNFINRLAKVPGAASLKNTAMAVWGQNQVADNEIRLNKKLTKQELAIKQYHQGVAKAIKDTRRTMSKISLANEDFREYRDTLDKLLTEQEEIIKKHPLLFDEVKNTRTGEVHSYKNQPTQGEVHAYKNQPTQKKVSFSSIGGMDFVVASLNLINLLYVIADQQNAINSVPFADDKDKKFAVVFSAAWFINNVSATIRAIELGRIGNNTEIMKSSYRALTQGGMASGEAGIAVRFVNHSLIASAAGVIAAGLEGVQVVKDFMAERDWTNKSLLIAKGIGIAGFIGSWGTTGYRTLLTRFFAAELASSIAARAIGANFWGAVIYLIASVLLIIFNKTQYEKWLRYCIWGKNPDLDMSAVEEYSKLIQLVQQPMVKCIFERQAIDRGLNTATLNVKSTISVYLPNSCENEKLSLYVGVGSNMNNFTMLTNYDIKFDWNLPKLTNVQERGNQSEKMPEDKIESMQDANKAVQKEPNMNCVNLHFKTQLMHFAQGVGASQEIPRINIFVRREDNNPYENGSKIKYYYQSKCLLGQDDFKNMEDLPELGIAFVESKPLIKLMVPAQKTTGTE